MTMTGTIPDPTDPTRRVTWQRCPEGTRLFDAWLAMITAPKPETFEATLAYAQVSDAAWDEYQAHVKGCDECKGKVER